MADEGAVREIAQACPVEPARPRPGIDALVVQLGVDRVRTDLAGVEPAPDRAEADVVLPPAEGARTMARREGRRLVEEEELREEARLEEAASLPALELEPAGDPPLRRIAPANPAGRVVEAAAVPVDEPARRARDQVAEGRDAVLKCQGQASAAAAIRSSAPRQRARIASRASASGRFSR